jgi:hypothetical protein
MQISETNIPKRNKTENVETYMPVSKPDLDDHWSYKWLFLSEELWVVLFVDVHVIVGEQCLTFFFFSISIQKDANNHAKGLLQKGAMCMYLI